MATPEMCGLIHGRINSGSGSGSSSSSMMKISSLGEAAEADIHFKALIAPDGSGLLHLAIGAAVLDRKGNALIERSKYLGAGKVGKTTAYFQALLDALECALQIGITHVRASSDSLVVTNLLLGKWEIKSKKLSELNKRLMLQAAKLKKFTVHLRRSGSRAALVNSIAAAAVASRKVPASFTNCIICFEEKSTNEMTVLKTCRHSFCSDCVAQHAEVKLKSGQVYIPCPYLGCDKFLSMEDCQKLLSKESLELLRLKLKEADIPEANRVYCPYKTCSELVDSRVQKWSALAPKVQCRKCSKHFCIDCRVPWHTRLTCLEYQNSQRDSEDAELHLLARERSWKRCKMCRRMIELGEGCIHITCRCGYEFCYLCEAEWINKKQTCNCELFDADYFSEDDEDDEFAAMHEDELDIYYTSETESSVEYGVFGGDLGYLVEAYDLDGDYDDYYLGSLEFDDFEIDNDDDFFDNLVTSASSKKSSGGNRFYKTKLCKFWSWGRCVKGDMCDFAHGTEELRSLSSNFVHGSSSGGSSRSGRSSSSCSL